MHKLFLAIFVTASSLNTLAFASIETVIGPVSLQANSNLANVMPSVSSSEVIISRDQYVISYNRSRRSPNWVAWKVESKDLGTVKRSNDFATDTDLEQYLSSSGEHAVEPNEYSGSCMDRGHQIPSGDRTDSASDNQETFFMSNMIPQTPYLNRVIWEHLEHYTRELIRKEHKKAYVVAGPIYDQDFGMIGPRHDIPVPSKDFKIIFVLDADASVADIGPSTEKIVVIMPNVLRDGSRPSLTGGRCAMESPNAGDANDWKQYQTDLSEVERESGLSFVAH